MIKFTDTGLKPEILEALKDMEFETTTEIQAQTIPFIINSEQDLLALAQTGTGKTAAFSLPMLNKIEPHSSNIQTLILCPTRELCLQISRDIESFSKYQKGVSVLPIFGGQNVTIQLRGLRNKPQIVVGTPGRVKDLQKRGQLRLDSINTLILDEADEMLNMGFKEELDDIISQTNPDKQVLLFSATMPREVERIAKNYMNNPEQISVGHKNQGTSNVSHIYYKVNSRDRYEALKRIADINPDIYAIVFCRTRRETQQVTNKLMDDKYNADAIHGDLSQNQRDYVMQRFREKKLQILVATDVAARGIDVNNLTHVINYQLPDQLESYIHRSGRTGRANSTGISVSIINLRENRQISLLERKVGQKFTLAKIPNAKDICEKRLFALVDRVQNTKINEEQISEFMPAIFHKLEELSKEEVITHFVSAEFNSYLEYYKNARDLNQTGGDRPRKDNLNYIKVRINIGKDQNIGPKSLIELINQKTNQAQIGIGDIFIGEDYALFEADKEKAEVLFSSLEKEIYSNTRIEMSLTTETIPSKPKRRSGGGRGGRGGYSRGGSRSGGGRGGYSRGGSRSGGGRSERSSNSRSGSRGGSSSRSSYRGGSNTSQSRDRSESRGGSSNSRRRSNDGGYSRSRARY